MNAYNPEADKPEPLPPRPRRRKQKGGYRYYLEDHPVLGPIVTLLIGSFCIYGTILSNLFRDFMLGPDPNRTLRDQYATVMAWGIAFVIGLMGLALIFLLWHLLEEGLRWARRRPAVCPRCGTAEVFKTRPFAHERVEGTRWETITCPQCRHSWHERR